MYETKTTPASDRFDPVPPLLEVKDGKMQEMRATRHTSQNFVALLEGLVKSVRCARD
jgi:hypothetical protein